MKTTSIDSSDETQYGNVCTGLQVGSGFDAGIKRESDDTAIVCVIDVASKREWLAEISVDRNENLQALARDIANCPPIGDGWFAAEDSEDWDFYANRWDAIDVA